MNTSNLRHFSLAQPGNTSKSSRRDGGKKEDWCSVTPSKMVSGSSRAPLMPQVMRQSESWTNPILRTPTELVFCSETEAPTSQLCLRGASKPFRTT